MKTVSELCRELRKTQTPAEAALWQMLRNRKVGNRKFLRQYPLIIQSIQGQMQFYIADFYCAEENLVIEADGPIHDLKKDFDKNRDEVLCTLGIRTLRFKNEDILQNPSPVFQTITQCFSPSLSPREGGRGGEFCIRASDNLWQLILGRYKLQLSLSRGGSEVGGGIYRKDIAI